MRDSLHPRLANGCHYRAFDSLSGIYEIIGPTGTTLRIIASDGRDPVAEGWEHVSVSLQRRCPTWAEMCFVKNLFWYPEEIVLQFHPAESEYISNHPNCLHMWRNPHLAQPMPPAILIGSKELGELSR